MSALRSWWRRFGWFAYPLLAMVLVVVVWQASVDVFDVPTYLVPAPTAVIATLVNKANLFAEHAWVTTVEFILGFALSIIIGIPLAVVMVSWRPVEQMVYPLLVGSQTIPKIAIAPLFLVWLGFGLETKVVIVFLVAFFPIVIETAVGLRSVPDEMIDLARSMGASSRNLFWKIRFPYALPNIFAGLKVASALAVIGAVVGEWVGADSGLGYLVLIAGGHLDTVVLFGAILLLIVLGIVSFVSVELVERLTIPWHVSVRKQAIPLEGLTR